jgi:FkbM family methyltransferase
VTGLLARLRSSGSAPLPPPYEYVQLDVERRLHEYLGVPPGEVRLVAVVGAWRGHEVGRMLPRYPACRFVCLEPNPPDFAELVDRYAAEERVACVHAAAADVSGTLPLRRTGVKGTASLLEPARLDRADEVSVPVVRLDDLDELRGRGLDCLWVDVQGAEDRVLAGAGATLARTRALFLEVATRRSPYVGGASFEALDAVAREAGLRLAALGTDAANGEGNALWLR